MTQLILASASPRRKEILERAGISFTIMQPDEKESNFSNLSVSKLVKALAKEKAQNVVNKIDRDCLVLGADTLVYLKGKILGKPSSIQDAYAMLESLSGRTHTVISGVCLLTKEGFERVFTVKTKVKFMKLSKKDIEDYIATKEPFDKAGGYGIQGYASKFIKKIKGDYYNVMGLPLSSVYSVIKEIYG